jgi:adenylate cyclase
LIFPNTDTPHLEAAHSLRSEELAAHRSAVIGRTVALVLITPLVTYLTPWPGPLLTYALLFLFAVLGWIAWLVAKSNWGKPWHQYAFVSADFMLLAFTVIYPNPLVPLDYPPQFILRFGTFVYFFILLAGLAYVYQPRLVLWGGISAAVSWIVGIGWLLNMPDTIWQLGTETGMAAALTAQSQPTFIDIGVRAQEVVVLLIVAGLLALAVARSRAVALRQARLAQERANLGRYFPRKTAQLLADRTDPFSNPSEHNAAVLFADLVAFTAWSEKHTPRETIDLLREIHGLLAEVVFRHNGTLDKFIGDGLMATFGTPEPSDTDASNALGAIVEMTEAFDRWQINRKVGEGRNLRLAVGVHYGPVVIGNIGSKDRLEFAVLGDTVNIASRLEGATRQVGCRGLVSRALVEAAIAEGYAPDAEDLAKLTPDGKIDLRGRTGQIEIYRM